jgi:outer membrane receptor for ferrienterochelin and colicins
VHRRLLRSCLLLLLTLPLPLLAQAGGTVRGRVVALADGQPLAGIHIRIAGSGVGVLSDRNGRYRLPVPAGPVALVYFGMGYQAQQAAVEVPAGGTVDRDDVRLGQAVVVLPETRVISTASRSPERVVESPAAIAVVDGVRAADAAATAQLPQLLSSLPGVFAPQNGLYDFNVGARGFTSFLTRRVLVLQDGRDLAIPTLSSQEWSALSLPLDQYASMEFVRGPGSALYGANAFSGVLNLITPAPRDAQGSQIALGAGELGTLRADLVHAGASRSGRWGWRVNAGTARSDTWDRARTELGALAREYAGAIDTARYPARPPIPGYEVRPLNGQTKEGAPFLPGAALGTPDAVSTTYATARLDRYGDDGSVLTAEAGTAEIRNPVMMTGAGRSQISEAARPWARVAWADEGFHVMGYWSGRRSGEQWSLASGTPQLDDDDIWHVEGQVNRPFAGTRGQLVAGGSLRVVTIDSKGTFLAAAEDDRADRYAALFGQARYALSERWSLVGAARYDGSNLYTAQWSPKAALVFTPTRSQGWRLTWNQAFQTPNPVERFLSQPAGAPLDLSALEAGLRASPLGGALAGVADGALFSTSAAVPVLALGNAALAVERVRSIEAGYKGALFGRGVVSVDVYHSRLDDFVTNLMVGANPAYAPWTAPDAVPEPARAALEQAVRDVMGVGLTRLDDASTALVLSLGNAGRATEWGGEIALGYPLSDAWTLEANAAYFRAAVARGTFVAGDTLLPNSPRHMGSVALTHRAEGRPDVTLGLRVVEAYDWRAGFYAGRVPARQVVDLTAGHDLTPRLRLQLVGTNLLDQRRYEAFGASLVGRRVLGRVVYRF